MVSSINNTDMQRAHAEAFVYKSDKNITKMAGRINNIQHHKDHKRAAQVASFATKTIPFIAAASTLAMGKGIKPAAKQGAIWTALIAIPAMVTRANNNIKHASATPENKKGHGLSFGGELVATLAGFWGATVGINKLAKNPRVNEIADNVIAKSREIFGSVSKKVKVPEGLAQKASELTNKAKGVIPEKVKTFVGETAESVKNSQAFKTIAAKSAKAGKSALKYAPEIALGSIIVGTLAYGIKEGVRVAETKKQLKQDQLKTARAVIDSYKAENAELKAQLAEKSEEA